MPPLLALVLSLGFSFVLLRRESKHHPEVSSAVWIPCIWLLILGSRPVSSWLSLGTPLPDSVSLEEGSPTDRLALLALMVMAFIVLVRRRIAWGQVFANNPWLFVFFAYCALSVLWSDFPGVAFKRWLKAFADPLMALVLATERHRAAAVATVLRRCAFLLLPLSIVFIKYYPRLGRQIDPWSGFTSYSGVGTTKNMLGYLLFSFGLLFVCTLVTKKDTDTHNPARRLEMGISVIFLVMIAYLYQMSDSKTSLLALLGACALVLGLATAFVRRNFGAIMVTTVVTVALLQVYFDFYGLVAAGAGRDTTLTGRTDIWAAVLAMDVDPLVGVGFQSFWLGDRLSILWARFPLFRPVQAHNGYIEMYLNLGWIGLCIFGGFLLATYRSARESLAPAGVLGRTHADDILAKFGVAYLTALVLYNVTEATFKPLNFLFIILLMVTIRYTQRQESAIRATATQRVESEASFGSMAGPRTAFRWQPTRRLTDSSGLRTDGSGLRGTKRTRPRFDRREVRDVEEEKSGAESMNGRIAGRHLPGHVSRLPPAEPNRRSRR